MSSWRECKLGEVISSISETYKFTNEKVIFLNTSDVYLGKIVNKNEFNPKDLPGQAKKRIKKNDLLFSEIRPANGRYAFVVVDDAENYVVSTKLMVLRSSENILPNFLNIFLTSKDMLEYLQMLAEDRSGTFPQITFDNISNIDISLPPLEEQKAIAEVLSSLDDKIDLLHRQNQTLESLAQTLFRQWFIEEAKEEWEEVTLSDVMELKYGKDHKHLNDGKIPIYGSGGIMRYGDTAIYENESILIPRKGTLSNIFYVDEPFWTVDTIFWSKINSEKISGKLLFEFLKTLNFSNMNVGSAVPSLTTKVLNEISFALPSLKEQEEFKQYTDNAWDKVKQNKKQIQTLENLRDTLLPKLLSGEVKAEI